MNWPRGFRMTVLFNYFFEEKKMDTDYKLCVCMCVYVMNTIFLFVTTKIFMDFCFYWLFMYCNLFKMWKNIGVFPCSALFEYFFQYNPNITLSVFTLRPLILRYIHLPSSLWISPHNKWGKYWIEWVLMSWYLITCSIWTKTLFF